MKFVVYSGYYYLLSLLFMFVGVYVLTRKGWCSSVRNCWLDRARLEERGPSDYYSALQSLLDAEDSDSSSDGEDELLTDY